MKEWFGGETILMLEVLTERVRHARGRAWSLLAQQAAMAPFLPWSLRRKSIALQMRANSDQNLGARFAAIDHCRTVAQNRQGEGKLGPIWQFWAQGRDRAPPIVKTCLKSVEMNVGEREHIVLTTETVGDYLDFPGKLIDRIPFWGWTKFSNLVRLMLLERHGGTWIDATVLIDRPIPQWIEDSDFFVFRWPYDPRILATWFMHARSENPLTVAISSAYQDYWLRAEEPGHYFMLHYLFEAVVLANSIQAKLWKDVPFHSATIPHELQAMLSQPFDTDIYRKTLDRSWIQKLTYKTEIEAPCDVSSFNSRLSEGLPSHDRPASCRTNVRTV